MSHGQQSAIDRGNESRVVVIDFNSDFYLNHRTILDNLQLLGIGGSLLNICKEF